MALYWLLQVPQLATPSLAPLTWMPAPPAHSLQGDEGDHLGLRARIVDHLRENEETLKWFIEDDEPFDKWVGAGSCCSPNVYVWGGP